ncbi:hypothetical protein Y1Q_0003290 [Alligator mississippiensis]|uniref:Uncharacterized protein n=1 Tax=Alligator mississippiensis TaxID=8496 RepID=A0A151MEJ2_ALLMI|nr:hypothetical protein Y1Q_0003290 [Alligator mississippiensis]
MPSQGLCNGAAAASDTAKGLQEATAKPPLPPAPQPLGPPCQLDWWQQLVQRDGDDKQWVNTFWLTQATFTDLLHQLWPHLECQDTGMCPALHTNTCLALELFSSKTCLALELLNLATPASLWYMGHLFSVGKATTGRLSWRCVVASRMCWWTLSSMSATPR